MKCALLIAAALAGCGADESGPAIEGQWVAVASDGTECELTFEVEGDGFAAGTVCRLNSGDLAAEIETGTVEVFEDELFMRRTKSTCGDTGAPRTLTMTYSFAGDVLRLGTPAGVFAFERYTGGASAGQVAFGCFEGDSFTRMPLTDL